MQRCKNCMFWTKEHPTAPGWRMCEGDGAEPKGWYITGDERECDSFVDKDEHEAYLDAKNDAVVKREEEDEANRP